MKIRISRPRWRAYSAPPNPLKGPTSNGRERERGEGSGGNRKEERASHTAAALASQNLGLVLHIAT